MALVVKKASQYRRLRNAGSIPSWEAPGGGPSTQGSVYSGRPLKVEVMAPFSPFSSVVITMAALSQFPVGFQMRAFVK